MVKLLLEWTRENTLALQGIETSTVLGLDNGEIAISGHGHPYQYITGANIEYKRADLLPYFHHTIATVHLASRLRTYARRNLLMGTRTLPHPSK